MKLYDYFRSSAAYRVRIALNLKGLAYERHEVHLVRDGGEHLKADYRAINPQARVPALELDDGTILTQSPAIREWIEETHPEPPLLPADPIPRARVRAVAAVVACDIHPINNLRVLQHLKRMGIDEPARDEWYRHWIRTGFGPLEAQLTERPGTFCCGETPTLADICLVPQVFNAQRLDVDLAPYPRIRAIHEACMQNLAFADAQPSRQPDAE